MGFASVFTAGWQGILWNTASVCVFGWFDSIAEGRRMREASTPTATTSPETEILEPTIAPAAETSSRPFNPICFMNSAIKSAALNAAHFVAHPVTVSRTLWPKVKRASYAYISRPRSSIMTQGLSQAVLVGIDILESGISPVMGATAFLATGNLLESFEPAERERGIAKPVALAFRLPRRLNLAPSHIMDAMERGTNRGLSSFFFNPHLHWTGGLTFLLSGNSIASAFCLMGFCATVTRNLMPRRLEALDSALGRANDKIKNSFRVAAHQTMFKRAGAAITGAIVAAPTRAAQWFVTGQQSGLVWLAGAFGYGVEEVVRDGVLHGTQHWTLNAAKMVCYTAAFVRLVVMEQNSHARRHAAAPALQPA